MNPSQDPASSGFPPSPPPPSAGEGTYDATPSDGYGAPLHGYGDPLGGPPAGAGGWQPWTADLRPVRRPWRRTVVVCLSTLLAIAAVGAPLGLLWSWICALGPRACRPARRGSSSTTRRRSSSSPRTAGSRSLGFGLGRPRRARRVDAAAPATGARGCCSGSSSAPSARPRWPGRWAGGSACRVTSSWRDTAVAGDAFDRPPDLHAHGALLVPAFAAVIVCTLLAGWSNDPDLDAARSPARVRQRSGPRRPGCRARISSVGAHRTGQIRQRHRDRPDLAQQRRLTVEQLQLGAQPGRRCPGAASSCCRSSVVSWAVAATRCDSTVGSSGHLVEHLGVGPQQLQVGAEGGEHPRRQQRPRTRPCRPRRAATRPPRSGTACVPGRRRAPGSAAGPR